MISPCNRGSRARDLCTLGVGLLAGLPNALAAARDDAVEPIRLEFRAEAECPDAGAFVRTLRARTARIREADGTEPARTFRVRISRGESGGYHGEFSIRDADDTRGGSVDRTIDGEACPEVFDALTLFAALSIDPDASTAAVPVAAAPPPTPEKPPAPAATTPVAPSARPARPRAATGRHLRWKGIAGADVGTMTGGTASRPLLLTPFVELGRHRQEAGTLDFAPAGRVSFMAIGMDTSVTPDGPAHLQLTGARLDLCPLELRIAGSLSARLCPTASGGVLDAKGVTIAHPKTQHLTWFAVGGLLRVDWNPWSRLVVEWSAGIDAPLRHDRFYFEPSTPVYTVPSAFANATFGAGVQFL